jgi:hypothetical protein
MSLELSKSKPINGYLDDFVQCNGGAWTYGGDCDCENPEFCKTPVVTQQHGITIYRADEIEFRLYCIAASYFGQAEGHRFMLSVDNSWIRFYETGSTSEIMERILQTVARRQH